MFHSIEDLPDSLRHVLPRQAQELYRAAYNRVVEKATMANSEDESDVAEAAHGAAMLAVQTEYRVDDNGRWQRQPVGAEMKDTGPDSTR